MSLTTYIKQHNQYVERMRQRQWAHAGDKTFDAAKLTREDKVKLEQMLTRDLSPGVLSNDGELRGVELENKRKVLISALAELGIPA